MVHDRTGQDRTGQDVDLDVDLDLMDMFMDYVAVFLVA